MPNPRVRALPVNARPVAPPERSGAVQPGHRDGAAPCAVRAKVAVGFVALISLDVLLVSPCGPICLHNKGAACYNRADAALRAEITSRVLSRGVASLREYSLVVAAGLARLPVDPDSRDGNPARQLTRVLHGRQHDTRFWSLLLSTCLALLRHNQGKRRSKRANRFGGEQRPN